MSLASGSRPCFCLSTKASCLTPGFVCLGLPAWFHPVTAHPLTTEPWIFPPVGNPTSGCGVFCTNPPPVSRLPGPHPAKEPILIPPPYTDSVK
ncbi:hypothetical protein CHARACLAT_008717 [Characodon lateralis]|uniref:Secreted protein n=1 Tax=Characodon lateralis TaxID=208331 RepID=A0ABU7F1Q4_9TELE|nr:hypothetical protein [Characodon lateralis]